MLFRSWDEWLQDYLDSLPEDLYEDVWDVQGEEDGLYDFTHCWGDDCKREEIYRHEVNMFKYEYRDSFIDEGEYFGTHGWDIGSLLDYERNNT